MRGSKLDVDPLDALLQSRKVTWVLPPELRERVLARAQSALEASAGIRRVVPLPRPAAVPATATALPPSRRGAMLRTAIAASIALVMGAVGAAAALRGRSALPVERAHVPAAPAATVAVAARPTPTAMVDFPVTARRAVSPRRGEGADPFAAEVHLLRRAQAAYSHGDFSTALTVLADHARRFPRGHLAEEREALRVRSLLGSGREAEAHRAAAAFSSRFPRSVLLPRLESASETTK